MKKNLIVSVASLLLVISSCNKKQTLKAEYSEQNISEKAYIIRDKTTKQASLRIDINGKWKLYSGPSIDKIDLVKPIAEGNTNGTFALNVNDTARSYFQLVTEEGKAIIAERHLPMTGGYNFRDLGGFRTQDGKYVKWGKVFRSDDLHNLTDADLKYLSSIPLISIVDFRAKSEIEAAPDKVPTSVHKDYAYSITPGNLNSIDIIKKLSPAQMDSVMENINRLLVTDSTYISQYKSYFALLQNPKQVPLMFHCSAGKDRTGMGAALFLFSLGVDEGTILKDYLASNGYLGDKYAPLIAKYPNMKSLFEVKPEFLKAGLAQIKKDHGSIDNYLTDVLNVDLNKMKQLYLYD